METIQKSSIFITIIFCLMVSAVITVQAQSPRAGIKGGLNLSNFYIDDIDDQNMRFGFHAGIYGQLPITSFLAIQPEINYSTRGAKLSYSGVAEQTARFNLNYIDIPVLAVIKLGEFAELHGGVYAGYLLKANIKTEGDFGSGVQNLDTDNFNTFDYGLSGGLGFNFGNMQTGFRYNYGLRRIASSTAANLLLGDAKNSLAQIYVSFSFQ
ncbi:MAG: PorT family protein [Cyclobacteriaceae bacterium]|nr:PorT family protein [Cyclobacteriaceae bacterium]